MSSSSATHHLSSEASVLSSHPQHLTINNAVSERATLPSMELAVGQDSCRAKQSPPSGLSRSWSPSNSEMAELRPRSLSTCSNSVLRNGLRSVRFTSFPCRPQLSMQRNAKFDIVTQQNQTVNSVRYEGNIFLTSVRYAPSLIYMQPKTASELAQDASNAKLRDNKEKRAKLS